MLTLLLALGVAGGFLFAPYVSLAVALAVLMPTGWVLGLLVMLFGGGR